MGSAESLVAGLVLVNIMKSNLRKSCKLLLPAIAVMVIIVTTIYYPGFGLYNRNTTKNPTSKEISPQSTPQTESQLSLHTWRQIKNKIRLLSENWHNKDADVIASSKAIADLKTSPSENTLTSEPAVAASLETETDPNEAVPHQAVNVNTDIAYNTDRETKQTIRDNSLTTSIDFENARIIVDQKTGYLLSDIPPELIPGSEKFLPAKKEQPINLELELLRALKDPPLVHSEGVRAASPPGAAEIRSHYNSQHQKD